MLGQAPVAHVRELRAVPVRAPAVVLVASRPAPVAVLRVPAQVLVHAPVLVAAPQVAVRPPVAVAAVEAPQVLLVVKEAVPHVDASQSGPSVKSSSSSKHRQSAACRSLAVMAPRRFACAAVRR